MTLTQKKYLGFTLGALLAILLAAPMLLSFANPASAGPLEAKDLFGGELTGDTKGYGSGTEFATAAGLGSGNLVKTITQIIRVALGFLGIIAVVIILLGGFKWMTSQGNTTKVDEAKKLIFAGIIGLVITLSAYAIASFVITQITSVTSTTTTGGSDNPPKPIAPGL